MLPRDTATRCSRSPEPLATLETCSRTWNQEARSCCAPATGGLDEQRLVTWGKPALQRRRARAHVTTMRRVGARWLSGQPLREARRWREPGNSALRAVVPNPTALPNLWQHSYQAPCWSRAVRSVLCPLPREGSSGGGSEQLGTRRPSAAIAIYQAGVVHESSQRGTYRPHSPTQAAGVLLPHATNRCSAQSRCPCARRACPQG